MKLLLTIILSLTLFSCYEKHLNEKIFRGKDFTVKWYKISTITTLDHYIDIERWGFASNIIKSSDPSLIYDIVITGDTITIKTTPRISLRYLASKKNGCIIKLDSTITTYEYMKKYYPEKAAKYINDTVN